MATKKNGTEVTALVPVTEYAVMKDETRIGDIIKANMGGRTLLPSDLDRLVVPSQGNTSWKIETIDGESYTPEVFGVIIYHKMARARWDKSIEEAGGESRPPVCRCDNMANPIGVGNPGGLCSQCPFNVWGSGKNGRGFGCPQRHILFIYGEHGALPFVISAPPGSLKNVGKYFTRLSTFSRIYWSVVTRFALEKHTSPVVHAQIVCSVASKLDGEMLEKFKKLSADMEPILASMPITRDDTASNGE